MTEKPNRPDATGHSVPHVEAEPSSEQAPNGATNSVARELFELTQALSPQQRAVLRSTLESLPMGDIEAILEEPLPIPAAPLPLTPEQRLAGRTLLARLQEIHQRPVITCPSLPELGKRAWRWLRDFSMPTPVPQLAVLGGPSAEQSSYSRTESLSRLLPEHEAAIVLVDVADELTVVRTQSPGHEPVYSARLRRIGDGAARRRAGWGLRVLLRASDGNTEAVRLSPRAPRATFPRRLPADWDEIELTALLEE